MKKYNNEKAIISLTSWKARISGVSKTIFSLLKQCPGFHIVLVLSEEEFPQKEKELPSDLTNIIDNDLIEVLWIYTNYKSLKKVLFTMNKYQTVPVISADDDLIYTCNYAQQLYDLWLKNPYKICTVNAPQRHTNGQSTLYFPRCFGDTQKVLNFMIHNQHLDTYLYADDGFYEVLRKLNNNDIAYLPGHAIHKSHTDVNALRNIYGNIVFMKHLRKIQSIDCRRTHRHDRVRMTLCSWMFTMKT